MDFLNFQFSDKKRNCHLPLQRLISYSGILIIRMADNNSEYIYEVMVIEVYNLKLEIDLKI